MVHGVQYVLLCSLYFSEISGHSYVLHRARRESDMVVRRLESLAIRVEYLELGLRKEQEKSATLQTLVSQLKSEVTDTTRQTAEHKIPQPTIEDISTRVRKDFEADLHVLRSGLIEEKRITQELASTVERCKDKLTGNTHSLDYLKKSLEDFKQTVDVLNKTVDELQCCKRHDNPEHQESSDGKRELPCRPLISPNNGWMNMSQGRPLVATFGCWPGFSIRGSRQRFCLPDGSWNGTKVHCETQFKRISCPKCFEDANNRTNPTIHELISKACGENIEYVHYVTVKRIARDLDVNLIIADVRILSDRQGIPDPIGIKNATLWMSKGCSCIPLVNTSYLILSRRNAPMSEEYDRKLEIVLNDQTYYIQYPYVGMGGTSYQRQREQVLNLFWAKFSLEERSKFCG